MRYPFVLLFAVLGFLGGAEPVGALDAASAYTQPQSLPPELLPPPPVEPSAAWDLTSSPAATHSRKRHSALRP